MNKKIKELTTPCFMLVTIFLMNNCSQNEQQTKITLYDTIACKGVRLPSSVISYKESNAFRLENLVYKGNGKVSVDIDKKLKEECCLVFFFATKNEFLTAYVDNNQDFAIHSRGTVLFGSKGHQIPVETLEGKVEYKITYKVWNSFDMTGEKGELYVFAVKGGVSPQSLLPGNQKDISTFNASSNVLKTNFEF